MFAYIGVSTFTFHRHYWNPWFILVAFVSFTLVYISRVNPNLCVCVCVWLTLTHYWNTWFILLAFVPFMLVCRKPVSAIFQFLLLN